jgi:hypothetical protein
MEYRPVTATEVLCECGHETTVFEASMRRWADQVPERVEGDPTVAIADDDGLFVCAGCGRRVYVPTFTAN